MKKIVFEQVGNIVLLGLFIAGLLQAVTSSQINSSTYVFKIQFGGWFAIFLLAALVFSLARGYFARRWHDYDPKKGEFSIEDEREQLISRRAAVRAYQAVICALVVAMCAFFFLATISNDLQLLKIWAIIGFGGCILIGFITYLTCWLLLDRK